MHLIENLYCQTAGRTGISLRVVTETFINAAGQRSYTKSRERWANNDLPLLRLYHANDPDDSRCGTVHH